MYSHPGASTVDHIQDNNYCEFARLTESLKHSVDKRLHYVLDYRPTQSPLRIDMSFDFTMLHTA